MVSQTAKIINDTEGSIKPNVKTEIVFVAIVSAELTPWKNFKNPNQKKIIPKLILKYLIALFAIQVVMGLSSLS